MIYSLIAERVGVSNVNTRSPPINPFFPLVFVRSPKLLLAPQPELVCVKELKSALHIVENGIVDVLNRFIQRKEAAKVSMVA
jgi:hypothetical protein